MCMQIDCVLSNFVCSYLFVLFLLFCSSKDGSRLWMAACSKTRIDVPHFKTVFFDIPLSCPPAVLREEKRCLSVKSYNYFRYPPPTEGPPVIHIRHKGPGHFKRAEPSDCVTCGNQILKFLTEVLHLIGSGTFIYLLSVKLHRLKWNFKIKWLTIFLQVM